MNICMQTFFDLGLLFDLFRVVWKNLWIV